MKPTSPDSPAAAVLAAVLSDPFVRASFAGATRAGACPWERVAVRPVELQGVRHWQVASFDGRKTQTKNLADPTAVLGLPVVVPEPGEYVARGAARQAAGLLLGAVGAAGPDELAAAAGPTGAMPEWPLALHASVEHPAQPHVRVAYAAAFRATSVARMRAKSSRSSRTWRACQRWVIRSAATPCA